MTRMDCSPLRLQMEEDRFCPESHIPGFNEGYFAGFRIRRIYFETVRKQMKIVKPIPVRLNACMAGQAGARFYWHRDWIDVTGYRPDFH